jgi:hypothetical protein
MAEPSGDPASSARRDNPGAVLAGRLAQYTSLWERAGQRLLKDDYHAEDLVEDWFTWWGMWVRDSAAAATLGWRTVTKDAAAADDINGGPDAG